MDYAVQIAIDMFQPLFPYCRVMRTRHAKLRYFDWHGQVHLAQGNTGGQQGDPLEMFVFNDGEPGVVARGQWHKRVKGTREHT